LHHAIFAGMIAVTQENSCANQQAIPAGELLDLQHLPQENRTLRWDRNFYKSLLERATARVIYPYSLQKHGVTNDQKSCQWMRNKQILT